MIKKRLKAFASPFQWAEILAILAFTVYFAFSNTTDAWWYILLDSVAAVCGVLCVVLCAGGKKSQYYWGFANIVAYIVIALVNQYYGEVMLNALYYLPTQFIGMAVWGKHYKQQEDRVEGQKLKGKGILIWSVCTIASVWGYKLLLDALGGNATLLDSMSTIFSIVANAMMVLRYREQWLLWIVVDTVTVVMWLLAGDFLMTVMWAIYLINAVYGFIMWTRLSSTSKTESLSV